MRQSRARRSRSQAGLERQSEMHASTKDSGVLYFLFLFLFVLSYVVYAWGWWCVIIDALCLWSVPSVVCWKGGVR